MQPHEPPKVTGPRSQPGSRPSASPGCRVGRPAERSAGRSSGGGAPPGRSVLERAAEQTYARIARDRRCARGRTVRLLDSIRAHLFDPELTVYRMKEACGIRDNSVVLRFRAETGLPPSRYLRERRMETAARLLTATALRVADVGALVGYLEASVFSRAFRLWAGLTPRSYRSQTRQASQDPEEERWVAKLTRVIEEIPCDRLEAVVARARDSAAACCHTPIGGADG